MTDACPRRGGLFRLDPGRPRLLAPEGDLLADEAGEFRGSRGDALDPEFAEAPFRLGPFPDAADGQTVMITTNSPHGATPALMRRPTYDAVADFTALSRMGTYIFVLALNDQVPARTLGEFLARHGYSDAFRDGFLLAG